MGRGDQNCIPDEGGGDVSGAEGANEEEGGADDVRDRENHVRDRQNLEDRQNSFMPEDLAGGGAGGGRRTGSYRPAGSGSARPMRSSEEMQGALDWINCAEFARQQSAVC